jgi:hypothetical protein
MKMGENGGNIALMVASGAFLSFFTFATPMLIHWVSKKYVVELVLALYSFFFVICFATISWCACLLQICGKGQHLKGGIGWYSTQAGSGRKKTGKVESRLLKNADPSLKPAYRLILMPNHSSQILSIDFWPAL